MARFAVDFLGCKVSLADVQGIRERLLADGHEEGDGADVVVLGTCCVTGEAVAKSRKAARRAARRARRVYVTGCAANLPGAFAGLPDRVVVVAEAPERAADVVARDVGPIGCTRAETGSDRVRAFVKIQDGCSFSCAFCVIPAVRGPSRSRSAEAVLTDVRRRVAQGHREIVLSGINLGCFRDRSRGVDLPTLIRAVGATPGVERLRLSSIEVNHVNDALLSAMAETPCVAPHLHVPLQSGDDRVLGDMGRRYDAATFLRRVAKAEGFNLTSDVIVGFPTENEAAFERTLCVVREAGITKVHVFPYSPRPGTETAALDPVPPAAKRERSARLRAASDEACRAWWLRKVGQEDLVLVDRPGRGYGADYSPWLVDGSVGTFVRARGAAVTAEGIRAA